MRTADDPPVDKKSMDTNIDELAKKTRMSAEGYSNVDADIMSEIRNPPFQKIKKDENTPVSGAMFPPLSP
jgi:hypothetical protein